MRPRRALSKLLVEPAAVATGDIAFNLIVFFLVCASSQPDTGRRQDLPASEQTKQAEDRSKHIELALTRQTNVVTVNGEHVRMPDLPQRLKRLLAQTPRSEDKVVVVKSKPDVPYQHWITVTTLVQDAGAIITIQREEERTVTVGN